MLVLAMERSRGGRTAALPPGSTRLLGQSRISGDHGGGATPVPIPNTAVKPASADGTWGETPWESRTSPEYFEEMGPCESGGPSLIPDPRRPLGRVIPQVAWAPMGRGHGVPSSHRGGR